MHDTFKMKFLVFFIFCKFLDTTQATDVRIEYLQPIEYEQSFGNQQVYLDEKKHQERSIAFPSHGQYVVGQQVVGFNQNPGCNVYLWQGEGNLTSYNYPFNYPDGVECVYHIPRVDFSTCALEITFHDFQLEADGEQCNRDYLQIGIKRFCGRLHSGFKEIVEFPYRETELRLKFRSDSVESGRGFWIEVARRYTSCYSAQVQLPPTLSVSKVQGRLTSYGYPDYYRENVNCTYFIEKQAGFCSVELQFVDFDVEEDYSGGCNNDYLLLEGTRYCGSTLYGRKVTIDFRGRPEITLSFISNDRTLNRGFDIRYKQISCSDQPVGRVVPPLPVPPKPLCDETHSSMVIYLRSVNYPGHYSSNVDCTYTIRRASVDVCELEFTFLNFEVEYDRLCRGDYLEINGGKICGPIPSKTTRRFRFYSSEMVVKFHSDDTVSGKGFEIVVQQKTDCSSAAITGIIPYDVVGQNYCDEEKSSQEFFIQSANFPQYYSNYMDCVYIVKKFSLHVCELLLTFLSFDLQDDRYCNYDYLEIDGQKYCGNAHHGSVKRLKFDKPEIIIRFHSDRSSSGRGFQIFGQQRRDCEPSYRIIAPHSTAVVVPPSPPTRPPPPSCDAVFTSVEFRLRSLNYPGNYDNNLHCILRIQKTSIQVCKLQLTFNAFDLEDDAGCRYDYIEIGQQRLCGFIPQGTVKILPFDGSEMVLRFRTDHTNTRPGFDLTIQQKIDCAPLAPPSRPLPLPTPVIVQPFPIPTPVILRPVNLFVPKPAPVVSPVILSQPITDLPSTGCDQIFSTWEFFFQSVNFPLNYGNNVDCTYRAQKFSLSVCEIELHFMSFDTEGHPDCAKDYLEVAGERLCGTITPGTIRRYKFDQPEFVIRFHSDHETSGVGYNILVRQKTSCPAAAPANIVAAAPLSRTVYVPPKTKQVVSLPLHVVPQTTVVPVYDFRLSQPSSQLASLNYPGNYGANINCTYRITRAKDICAVELYFNDFDVQSSPDCRNDYLIFGGKRYCGNELKGQTRMLYFEHSSEAVMNFVTDNIGTGKGWWCFYRQVPCSEMTTTSRVDAIPGLCEPSFNDELGFIKSRNYPLALYSSNEDCYYRIKRSRSSVCSVELTFTDFSLEPSTNCVYDYLEINRRRYCGTDLQRKTLYLNFPIGSDDILLHFKTNDNREDRGFFVQVRQLSYACSQSIHLPAIPAQYRLDDGGRCNAVIHSEISSIHSPDYPATYPANSDCTYTVVKSNPAVCGLQLDIAYFSVESSRHCLYDYLQTPMGDRMCGNSWTGVKRAVPFPFHKDTLVFVFHSDSRNQDQGFTINIRQITTGCP